MSVVQWLVANSYLSAANMTYVGNNSFNTKSGNTLVFIIGSTGGIGDSFNISDNKGNPSPITIWQQTSTIDTNNSLITVCALNNIVGGNGHSFNVSTTPGTTDKPTCFILDVGGRSNQTVTNLFESSNSNVDYAYIQTHIGPAIQTFLNGYDIINVNFNNFVANTDNYTPGAGYTQGPKYEVINASWHMSCIFANNVIAGNYIPAYTTTNFRMNSNLVFSIKGGSLAVRWINIST